MDRNPELSYVSRLKFEVAGPPHPFARFHEGACAPTWPERVRVRTHTRGCAMCLI